MAEIQGQANKVIVAFIDGRRLKGYVLNFSPLRDSFSFFPDQTSPKDGGIDVILTDLKAVFFVKDLAGNPAYQEIADAARPSHGRKVEVRFSDGETITGATEAYSPQKRGFFLFPADAKSNNLRIFVINKNIRNVRTL